MSKTIIPVNQHVIRANNPTDQKPSRTIRMKTLIISDLHLGVQRTGGTTIASAAALRAYGHDQHRALLRKAAFVGCKRVVINGDLADTYDIPLLQALQIYEDTDNFLKANPDKEMVWGLGNHDLSKDSSKLGTVAFIGALLSMKHENFKLMDRAGCVTHDLYIIPHVANQDLFDLELTRIPDNVKFVLLHCNYDNKFACAADHSLNLSRDQAKALKARGLTMIFGHEHQGKESLGGAVIVVGNQFPSSISDCLPHGDAQKSGTKRCLVIDHETCTTEFVNTWAPEAEDGGYKLVDWRELSAADADALAFIRVEGQASTSEAADVIKAISSFRQRSQAYVITNAVKVEQAEGLEDLADSIEDVRSVNVIEMLLDHLDPQQKAAVQALYETQESANV